MNKDLKVIVAVLVLAFLWFQARPSVIKSWCSKDSKERARKLHTYKIEAKKELGQATDLEIFAADNNMYIQKDADYLYESCLQDKGL